MSLKSSANITATNALEQTLPNAKQKTNRKFNLNQFIQNAVYPAECPSDEELNRSGIYFNASYQINHLSRMARPQYENTISTDTLNETVISQNLNESIVDEGLVLSMSQKRPSALNDSFSPEDGDFLDILRQLEDQECHDDVFAEIEEGSDLAPLTQTSGMERILLSQKQSQEISRLEASAMHIESLSAADGNEDIFHMGDEGALKSLRNASAMDTFAEEHFADSDDDLLNDFSMALDPDEFIKYE